MPAKSTSKKVTQKTASSQKSVEEPPHPQILARQAVETDAPSAAPLDLEEMLENDGDESVLEQKNKLLYSAGALVTAGIILATIGVFTVFLNAPKAKKQEIVKQDTLPSPTPAPAFLRSDVTFEVLNASGVSGAAAKGAQSLTDKGYTVVKTGNAKKQTATEVFVSPSVTTAQLQQLLGDLSTMFGVSSSSGSPADSTATARLILGSK